MNSQSGKGGIAYLLQEEHGLELPRRLGMALGHHVQEHADRSGGEVSAADLWEVLRRAYLSEGGPGERFALIACDTADGMTDGSGATRTRIVLARDGVEHSSEHAGIGPVEALTAALRTLGADVEVLSLHQTGVGSGNDVEALTFVEYRRRGRGTPVRAAARRST